jgi:purine-binding chemotaxis protein CheW
MSSVQDSSSVRQYQLVAFRLGAQQYAVRLACVQRIVRMVEIQHVPHAPRIVLGIVNFEGRAIPVLDIRKRFGLPFRQPAWNDLLLIAETPARTVSFAVDSVIGVVERSAHEVETSHHVVPGLSYVAGITLLDGGIVFIHDLNEFLSLEEEAGLREAMTESR